MMKMRKNEQGYALVIVLFLVVFIMAISAVFMRGAISNAKQERKVDESHLSVVAAEMGVDYYTTLFTNEFLAVRDDAWEDAEDDVRNDVINKEAFESGSTIEDFRSEVISNASEKIIGKLHGLQKKLITEEAKYYPPDVYFENPENPQKNLNPEELLKNKFNIVAEGTNDDIHIRTGIIGKYPNGNKSTLRLHLTFLMPGSSEIIPNPDDSNWFTNFPVKLIDKPEEICSNQINTEPCLGTKFDDITSGKNKIIYFDRDIGKNNKGNSGRDFNGLKIYTTSDLSLENMGGTKNLNVFAKGDVYFKNSSSGFSDSVIISEKKLTADQLNFKRLKVQVNELVVNNHYEVNDSVVFVSGDFTSTGNNNKFTLGKNSKMCVGGNVNYSKMKININDTSYLYILKDNAQLQKIPGVVKVDTLEALQDACKVGDGNNIGNIKWDDPVIDVNY